MSPKLMAAIRLSCSCELYADFEHQLYSAIVTQKVAGQRQPPNLCQLRTTCGLVDKQHMQPGQTELPLMLEDVNNYNRQRRVSGYTTSSEDIANLKVLCLVGDNHSIIGGHMWKGQR